VWQSCRAIADEDLPLTHPTPPRKTVLIDPSNIFHRFGLRACLLIRADGRADPDKNLAVIVKDGVIVKDIR
jgi:hypothetical protein